MTQNNDFTRSVAAVVIKDGKVLLARHTYGAGKGRLIIPGGYILEGEMPEDAVVREYLEETGVTVKPARLLGVRFNTRDWYAVFAADYVSGEARSDGDENSEVIWLDVKTALADPDVPDLSKKLIECALGDGGLGTLDYDGKNPPYALYADSNYARGDFKQRIKN